jgi:hypothetical protein
VQPPASRRPQSRLDAGLPQSSRRGRNARLSCRRVASPSVPKAGVCCSAAWLWYKGLTLNLPPP